MGKLRLQDVIFGYSMLEVGKEKIGRAADALFKQGVSYKTVYSNDKSVALRCSCGKRKLELILGDKFEYTVTCGGIPSYILSKRKRVGLLLGFILCIAVIFLSSTIVWEIEVYGNENLSDDYVKSILVNYGLEKGRSINGIDLDKLHHQVLLDNGSVGWLRVNFRGTVAVVEVMEYRGSERTDVSPDGSNLVSSRDALILSVYTVEGTPAVKVGDTVKAGELLIGGISDSNLRGYSLKNAEGSVIGEVCDDFLIKIPYETSEKSYTGETFTEKSIEILGKRIKLSKNSRNFGEECDIIVKRKRIEPFDVIKLPIELYEVTYIGAETVTISLTPEQAASAAKAKLDEYLREVSLLGDVVSISYDILYKADYVELSCKIFRTEDICRRVKLSTKNVQ